MLDSVKPNTKKLWRTASWRFGEFRNHIFLFCTSISIAKSNLDSNEVFGDIISCWRVSRTATPAPQLSQYNFYTFTGKYFKKPIMSTLHNSRSSYIPHINETQNFRVHCTNSIVRNRNITWIVLGRNYSSLNKNCSPCRNAMYSLIKREIPNCNRALNKGVRVKIACPEAN